MIATLDSRLFNQRRERSLPNGGNEKIQAHMGFMKRQIYHKSKNRSHNLSFMLLTSASTDF